MKKYVRSLITSINFNVKKYTQQEYVQVNVTLDFRVRLSPSKKIVLVTSIKAL